MNVCGAAVTETVNTMATQLTVQIRCALLAFQIAAADGEMTHPILPQVYRHRDVCYRSRRVSRRDVTGVLVTGADLDFLNLVRSLSKTIDAEVQGEMATLKETVNSMVSRLRVFSSEVTRVAREVGTDGQLGGQAVVHGVEGTWKELVSAFLSLPSWCVGRVLTGLGAPD